MQYKRFNKTLKTQPMEGKIAKDSDEVQDERSEPKGILDESLNLARVRHGRRLESFGEISTLSQICVQINGGDTCRKF